MKKNYLYSADLIRAIAIVFVVVVHICSEYLGKGSALGSAGWWFANIFETIAKVAVPLFVMLSGSLLLDPQKDYTLNEFYKRRFSTIGIPLLFWPLFYYFSLHFLTRPTITLTGFMNDYIFLNMFYHLYFLYIIAGLYLIAPFLRRMLSHLNPYEKKVLVSGALLLSLLITPLVYFTQNTINYWSIFTVFIPFIGYFLAGQYLKDVMLNKAQINRRLSIYVMLTFVVAVSKYFAYAAGSYSLTHYLDDVLSFGVMAMSLLIYPILLNLDKSYSFLTKSKINKIVIKLSSASFGIYLIHPIFIYVIKRILGDFLNDRNTLVLGVITVETVCILLASYLSVNVLKKLPLLKLLF